MMRVGKKIQRTLGEHTIVRDERDIDPDEIFLDSSNLPNFDVHQFEGRLVKPISRNVLYGIVAVFFIIGIIFGWKVWGLQITDGAAYANRSAKNALRNSIIFPLRGIIEDRNGVQLAWNEGLESTTTDFALRKYAPLDGIAHVVGYVQYPAKDIYGVYYNEDFIGKDGAEKYFNDRLSGTKGLKIVETDAVGKVVSESKVRPPVDGQTVKLSIDARLSQEFYKAISSLARQEGYQGGAAMMMDIYTGEIITMVSYPEYNPNTMSLGENRAAINAYLKDSRKPFLNRATDGLYTPGSSVKPFMGLAALTEGVITPEKKILSTGSISIQNPYNPELKSVFRDWKAHGWIDLRDAIAVSSDVYFYEVGGGYEDQKGMGIYAINKYMNAFGFGDDFSDTFFNGSAGVIPNPEWKAVTFADKVWRVGDTYNTVIGQYGFQVSLTEVVRALATLVHNGVEIQPTILKSEDQAKVAGKKIETEIPKANYTVVKEGMRQGVVSGIAKPLNIPGTSIAAKTGTAELGAKKEYVNSWITGFFPYENPRYVFVTLMEKGPHTTTVGALYATKQAFQWMVENTPEYFK